jgi:rhamnulokinase
MTTPARFLAIDLGASGGRAMASSWSGERFQLEELHRFPNGGVQVGCNLYWDALGLWQHLLDSLMKHHASFADAPAGIAVDAWGVDFALLDANGRLLGNPFHYRDRRTEGMAARLFEIVPEEEWFAETGVQTMEINTLFQLYSMVHSRDPLLAAAHRLVMVPDLFLYFLSGEQCAEYTEATTTQMVSLRRSAWAASLLERVGISPSLLPPIVPPAKVIAPVRSRVLEGCGFSGSAVAAIAAASHDTACAVVSIPEMDDRSVFLCCGTWSLIGIEAAVPNTSPEARRLGFTNEGSADGGILLLRNLTGLWILQECLRHWKLHGSALRWDDLVAAAREAPSLRSCFDPNHPHLQAPPDMPAAIRHCCGQTRQPIPESVGEIARCAFESLALKIRSCVESLAQLTGRNLETLRIVGGGCHNSLLCQLIADCTGLAVAAGPVEASALGNAMLQAIATGHISDIGSGRAAMAASIERVTYQPHRSDAWDEAWARFRQLEVN